MKTLSTLVLLLIAVSGIAQVNWVSVNYDSVEAATTNPDKDSHYPKLLQRFNKFDTSLTLDEYRFLYYGFAFDAGYAPYQDNGTSEIMPLVNERKYDKALDACDRLLATNPVSITTNFYKGFVLMNMAENDSSRRYAARARKLINAILSSGNGLTCETAYKVIYVSDEYTLLRDVFDAEPLGRRTMPPCDRFNITKSKNYSGKTIFFDYSANDQYFKRKYPGKKQAAQ
ncbi:MAG TPA: DUF4919 domain-containing protein [Niastella sp.]|nr:DUF4919 domain-containing protein [Niastella sp.]